MFDYTAFGAFGSPNALENLDHLETTYIKWGLFNSQTQRLNLNAMHQKWCGVFGGTNVTAANVQTLVTEQSLSQFQLFNKSQQRIENQSEAIKDVWI